MEPVSIRDWSVSLYSFGATVEGVDDVEQAIAIILRSPPGCDPLRPDFACDLVSLIDRPVTAVSAEAVRRIRAALIRWEPRIAVTAVRLLPGDGQDQSGTWAEADITYSLRRDAAPGLRSLLLPLRRGGV
jgi:phage baseplate assembly protein W